jgi:hypothetical protein
MARPYDLFVNSKLTAASKISLRFNGLDRLKNEPPAAQIVAGGVLCRRGTVLYRGIAKQ